MSPFKSKCWYSNNCLHFLKCTVLLVKNTANGTAHLYVMQSKAQRGQHWKGKQYKCLETLNMQFLKYIYCFNLSAIFKVSFLFIKAHIFILCVFIHILNHDTFSVAPSLINDNGYYNISHWDQSTASFCHQGPML